MSEHHALKRAARAYAKQHNVSYTAALRVLRDRQGNPNPRHRGELGATGHPVGPGDSSGVVVIGAPGAGKSIFTFTRAREAAKGGTHVLYLDTVGTFARVDQLEHVKVIRLVDLPPGALNPFVLLGANTNVLDVVGAVVGCVRDLLGGLSEADELVTREAAETVSRMSDPCLGHVITHLRARKGSPTAWAVAARLEAMVGQPFAPLWLNPAPQDTVSAWETRELTVLTVPSELTPGDRVTTTILHLLLIQARGFASAGPVEQSRAVYVDALHPFGDDPYGTRLIGDLCQAQPGTEVVLTTHNQEILDRTHVGKGNSTVFAFRAANRANAADTCRLLGIDVNPTNEERVMSLRTGECVARTPGKPIETLQVLVPDTGLVNAVSFVGS